MFIREVSGNDMYIYKQRIQQHTTNLLTFITRQNYTTLNSQSESGEVQEFDPGFLRSRVEYIYIYIYIYTHTYIYIYIYIHLHLSLSLYISIYVCMYIYIYIYICSSLSIHIYIYTHYTYTYESMYRFSLLRRGGERSTHAVPGV